MILANINSNISKRYDGVILPSEDWPTFDPIDPNSFFSFISEEDSPACWIGIQGDPEVTWNTPTSPITVKYQVARAQVGNSVAATAYFTLREVLGSIETLGIFENFKDQYFSQFGMTGYVDGNYAPERILLVDAYGRERVEYENFRLISTA